MTHHVIIGGGPVATNAMETIRSFDGGSSQITLISDEPAHSRMALPYWLSQQIPREHTHTADETCFERLRITARIGQRATKLDPDTKTVSLSDGSSVSFDKLLIATGASPARLDLPGADLPGVQHLWSLQHTEQLINGVGDQPSPHVLMIGAGFVGLIMLNAMAKLGWQLTVVERESQLLPKMLDRDAATLMERWLAPKGISVHCNATVRAIREADGGQKLVVLDDDTQIAADAVIVATGIVPNLGLVRGTGITIDQGILVNDRMQTSLPDIYAGGDVAQGPVLFSDRPGIHAIQPTAVDHGRVAGANMAGQNVHYPGSLLMNVLDCCGLQSASLGHWSDPDAEAMVTMNSAGFIYRKLVWTGDRITGAIFVGRANDLGMLTDVGMVKGILQTQTPLGAWKEFLRHNPFDFRRPYVAAKVAQKLAETTLLGRPAEQRNFHFRNQQPQATVGSAHALLVATKTS